MVPRMRWSSNTPTGQAKNTISTGAAQPAQMKSGCLLPAPSTASNTSRVVSLPDLGQRWFKGRKALSWRHKALTIWTLLRLASSALPGSAAWTGRSQVPAAGTCAMAFAVLDKLPGHSHREDEPEQLCTWAEKWDIQSHVSARASSDLWSLPTFWYSTSTGTESYTQVLQTIHVLFTTFKSCSPSFSPTWGSMSSFHLGAGVNKHNLEHSC